MTEPWLTVATVVKDDPEGLRRTAVSLTGQDLDAVQYVVVDSSGDQAVVPHAIEDAGLTAVIHWRPPEGVYAAMNAALAAAEGRYVYFANAGDTLHADVLSPIRVALSSEPVWAFGRIDIALPDGRVIREDEWNYDAERERLFARRYFPPHQGVIMRSDELRRQGGFDTSYRVVADYVSVLKASLQGRPVEVGRSLGTFEMGGLSTSAWRTGLKEFHRARREVYRPTGWTATRERLDTADTWLRTSAYHLLKGVRGSGRRPR